MESITTNGVTYKVGDMLKFIQHERYKDKKCIIKDIKEVEGDIFLYVSIEGRRGIFGGYYHWRFKHYKKSNIFNY